MPIALALPDGAPPAIPVVVIEDAADAAPLARALLAGGIRVIEVTLRSTAALAAIKAIATDVPDMFVGAGTLLSPEDMAQAAAAGAQFLVSPGATQSLINCGIASQLPFLPGVATASEAMALREVGFRRMKFFPADAAGGIAGLKGLGGPLPDLAFCPTGGVGADNAAAYLALDNVFAVGGSWLAPAAAIRARDWRRIETLAAEAARLA
jgi:2-dehydro-3-deoxyphosphogluconate aldolase / (4S)-4-hydroxy-2-oxoglutarate aldolase